MTITIPIWLLWTLGIVGTVVLIPLGFCAYIGYVLMSGKSTF